MGLVLLLHCAACSTPTMVSSNCPQPNELEVDDYELIVDADPDRPAVRWIGRVVGYCWPEQANAQRR